MAEGIFLVGLSMGGILSLVTATRLRVEGVVAMSTPYKLPDDPRLRWIKQTSWFLPYMPKGKEDPGSDWFDQEAFRQHVSYPQNPVRSIWELTQLMAVMQASLSKVTTTKHNPLITQHASRTPVLSHALRNEGVVEGYILQRGGKAVKKSSLDD